MDIYGSSGCGCAGERFGREYILDKACRCICKCCLGAKKSTVLIACSLPIAALYGIRRYTTPSHTTKTASSFTPSSSRTVWQRYLSVTRRKLRLSRRRWTIARRTRARAPGTNHLELLWAGPLLPMARPRAMACLGVSSDTDTQHLHNNLNPSFRRAFPPHRRTAIPTSPARETLLSTQQIRLGSPC